MRNGAEGLRSPRSGLDHRDDFANDLAEFLEEFTEFRIASEVPRRHPGVTGEWWELRRVSVPINGIEIRVATVHFQAVVAATLTALGYELRDYGDFILVNA